MIRAALRYAQASFGVLPACVIIIAVGPPASAQIRTTTYDGIPLDEPLVIRLRDVLFRVPAGYLAPWPSLRMRSGVNGSNGFAFNFWMPSRRYVEIGDASLVETRPQERGRPPPALEAHVVKVRNARFVGPKDLDDYWSPVKRFEKSTSRLGRSAYSFESEGFGLVRFWRHNWPYPKPEPFLKYRHVEGSDPQILLRCTAPDYSAPDPLCDGYVYIPADELSFYIRFSRNDLPRWRENVLAVRDLFKSWSQAP